MSEHELKIAPGALTICTRDADLTKRTVRTWGTVSASYVFVRGLDGGEWCRLGRVFHEAAVTFTGAAEAARGWSAVAHGFTFGGTLDFASPADHAAFVRAITGRRARVHARRVPWVNNYWQRLYAAGNEER